MPCEKPVIAPIDDACCFSCFVEGRGPYAAPIAIVLHEVDEHIEALNNRMENCCHDDPDCHNSFHYGVGHDGRIINWVEPDNTAWSFDPDNSDVNCGTCGWSIAVQEGTNVDPNLYTINIAVSTGILAFDQSSPNSLSENNYPELQYKALYRLVGWLAETYGIVVNQNTIWRHCKELNDFPGSCDECFTYSRFLEDVQACIDTANFICDYTCSCWKNAEPTTPCGCDLGTWMPVDADDDECDEWRDCDCSCDVLQNLYFCDTPVELRTLCLPFERCEYDCKVGVKVCIDPDNPTNTVVLSFEEEQNNLRLCFGGLDTTDVIEFSPAPDSVDGDFVLNGDEVTSSAADGSGCVVFAGPVTDITIIYRSTDPVIEEDCICLYELQSDECYCHCPANAVPGVTTFMGCDCKCYTLPDIGAAVDLCALITAAIPPALVDATPGVTMLLGRDCNAYYLPEFCDQIAALPIETQPDVLWFIGQTQADCTLTPVLPTCDPTEFAAAALSLGDITNEVGFHRMRPSLPTREATNGESLIPATDGVVYLDAENGPVIFTLTAPGPCDPTEYWIKRKDCNVGNTVTINGGANTIDTLTSIQLGTPGPYGGCGESVHLHWDGVNWSIL